jgi:hypothetical protein
MPRIKEKWREDEREIAELIWCAAHLHHILAPSTVQEESVTLDRGESQEKEREEDTLPIPEDKDSTFPKPMGRNYHPPQKLLMLVLRLLFLYPKPETSVKRCYHWLDESPGA